MSDLVRYEVQEGVAVLTLDNPPVNALSDPLLDALDAAISRLQGDTAVEVVVITGAGKAFVAGADISRFPTLDQRNGEELARKGQLIFDRLAKLSQPVIAAVNGFALGGGCELALACDMRVVAANARLGQPEVNLGLLPGYGGSQRLPRLVGAGQAKLLIMTGDMVNGEEAYRIGLAEVLAPEGQSLQKALEVAQKIRAKAPLAIRQSKRAVDQGLGMSLAEGLALEARSFGELCTTEDQKEGARAFLEKRPARFQGK